ncbi:MAG: glucose-1-phosphate cytidylyltransferase [Gemmataceae bacterium]|nr:glucose-1-phosphate cytidylyltransferase [Gemmataceae bacterium]
MQVVILCGGQGTRIRDVADDIPKPIIPIGNRPILWHIMKGFAQHGFNRFVLCLGYKAWVIKRYFLDYHLFENNFSIRLGESDSVRIHGSAVGEDWEVTLVETGLASMTGCRIKRVERFIQGDRFLLTYGDGVADVNVTDLVRFHRSHGKMGTVTAVRQPGRFGELEQDGDRVVEFSEKPLISRGWINGGFFVFERAIFDHLQDDVNLVFEQQPLKNLAHGGELRAFKHHGFWHPMDSSRDYRFLNDLWDEGKAPWKTWTPETLKRAA